MHAQSIQGLSLNSQSQSFDLCPNPERVHRRLDANPNRLYPRAVHKVIRLFRTKRRHPTTPKQPTWPARSTHYSLASPQRRPFLLDFFCTLRPVNDDVKSGDLLAWTSERAIRTYFHQPTPDRDRFFRRIGLQKQRHCCRSGQKEPGRLARSRLIS